MDTIKIPRPDDWHLHLRDGEALKAVLPYTARRFGRAIVMPNLKPPVVTVADAAAYRARILAALPDGLDFTPLMTLYLTDNTRPDEIDRAVAADFVHGVKLYPAGATTNSDSGVTDIGKVDAVLGRMAELGLPLLLHGEVTHGDVDIFEREARFLDGVLSPLLGRHPGLRVVLEHITTAAAARFVASGPPTLAATITAHHLLVNRNAMLAGGIRPHLYCLPILKREEDRQALVSAATGDDARFFLGTDSAPHAIGAKESACGCAGCFTAHAGIELYAEVFEAAGALERLGDFASRRGPAFYGLPVADTEVTLERQSWTVPDRFPLGQTAVRPFRAGGTVAWRLRS
ncbi:MAG: dihydroorotase [Myxococcota bacterium]|nr:dihydroorotase [Myxococcota bacterium]